MQPQLIVETARTRLTDTRADLFAGVPAIVDHVKIRWGRATARTHQEPGSIVLTILAASASPPIRYGETVYFQYDTDYLAYGTVSAITSTPIEIPTPTGPRRYWEHAYDFSDVIAKAAATRLAATPWPSETPAARAAHINQAAGWNVIDVTAVDKGGSILARRDVDNASALEIAHRTLVEAGTVVEGVNGLLAQKPPGAVITFPSTIQGIVKEGSTDPKVRGNRVKIPANRLTAAARHTDRRSLLSAVNVAGFTYRDADNPQASEGIYVKCDERSYTVHPSPRRHDDAPRLTIDTDMVIAEARIPATAPGRGLQKWIKQILEASQYPIRHIEHVEIIDPTDAEIKILATIPARTAVVIDIVNVPEDLGPLHRVVGGEITFHGTARPTLTLELEPAEISGTRPLRFRDVPLLQNPQEPYARIHHMGNIRIRDGAAVSISW